MGKIIGIVAVSPEGIIAINNKMPWNVSEDLKYFKQTTLNSVVIMGRVTWETLGKRCLPNRVNYVISKLGNYNLIADTGGQVFTSIDSAINEAQLKYPEKDIFIIGGASLYKQTLHIMDEVYITIINDENVNHCLGDHKYLEGYPNNIDDMFIKIESRVGSYATYQKYKRRIINKINPTRFF
jgi:dihydrofolate reductase